MEFNVKTATNDELVRELKRIEMNFNSTKSEMRELIKRLQLFSDAYEKIKSVLISRGVEVKKTNMKP